MAISLRKRFWKPIDIWRQNRVMLMLAVLHVLLVFVITISAGS